MMYKEWHIEIVPCGDGYEYVIENENETINSLSEFSNGDDHAPSYEIAIQWAKSTIDEME